MKEKILVLCLLFSASLLGMTEIQCTMVPIDRSDFHPRDIPISTSIGKSNWCGYVAVPNPPPLRSVSYAAGCWVVPKLKQKSDSSCCTIWVGIDGFSNKTVEQIGTYHEWASDGQINYAWFEMYPNGPYRIDGFPINTGDQISVRLGYQDGGYFVFVIFNHTQGLSTTVPISYTTSTTVQRSSAEWIVEAPTIDGVTLPLADFEKVVFNYCSVFIHGVKGVIGTGVWANDAITMQTSDGVKAEPSALMKNGTCFIVDWEHE